MAEVIKSRTTNDRRMQLIARVRIAHDEWRDRVRRFGADSARVRAARIRLWILNRALAMVAVASAA